MKFVDAVNKIFGTDEVEEKLILSRYITPTIEFRALRQIESNNVAGNASFEVKAPDSVAIRILRIYVFVDTDATVANRYMFSRVENKAGTYTIMAIQYSAAITANQTNDFYANPFYDCDNQIGSNDLLVMPNEVLKFSLVNGVAGDFFKVFALVEEVPID